MKLKKICKNLRPLLRKVIVVDRNVVNSAGSGVIVDENGTVLTAKHVIADEKGNPFTGHILVSGLNSGLQQYIPVSPLDLSFNFGPSVPFAPIEVDLCILKPVQKIQNADYISLANEFPDMGDKVIMAGFPEDIDEPFYFLKNQDTKNPDIKELLSLYQAKFKHIFRQQMFKHAIVGNIASTVFNKVNVEGLKGWSGPRIINIDSRIYWLDNHLTYGGSGGPLVNKRCELIGIMTEKTFTSLKLKDSPNVMIPSGTGMALSHKLISWMLPHI